MCKSSKFFVWIVGIFAAVMVAMIAIGHAAPTQGTPQDLNAPTCAVSLAKAQQQVSAAQGRQITVTGPDVAKIDAVLHSYTKDQLGLEPETNTVMLVQVQTHLVVAEFKNNCLMSVFKATPELFTLLLGVIVGEK